MCRWSGVTRHVPSTVVYISFHILKIKFSLHHVVSVLSVFWENMIINIYLFPVQRRTDLHTLWMNSSTNLKGVIGEGIRLCGVSVKKDLIFAPSPVKHTSVSWAGRRASVLMHPCTCRPFHPCPHIISPSLPLSLYHSLPSPWKWSVSPAFYFDTQLDLAWLSSAWHSPAPATDWAGWAGCCVITQPGCQPSVSAMTQSKRATTEDLWQRRWTVFVYDYFSPSLPVTYPEPACCPSQWQRHTEQRSSTKVTTWSDVTTAKAARTKAASAPFGIRTRLDGGP